MGKMQGEERSTSWPSGDGRRRPLARLWGLWDGIWGTSKGRRLCIDGRYDLC